MGKFISFFLFPLLLISQSNSQALALGGLGRSLDGLLTVSQNICAFHESPYISVAIHHLNRAGLKDLNREILSLFKNRGKKSYSVSYQHFGNQYYQENQLQVQTGIQVLDELKLGLGIHLQRVQKIELGTRYKPASELLLNTRISPKINYLFRYQLDWSNELKKQRISSEFVWWLKERLAVLSGFEFDFMDRETLQIAWLYLLHKDFQIQQAFSFSKERSIHFGFTYRFHSWSFQLAYAYHALSPSQIGLSLFHFWE